MTENFYVNVESPVELRRKLLETSKSVVLALQKFEKFKLERIKKLENYDLLKRNIKEINDLVVRLKKELPAIKLPKREEPRRIAVKAAPKSKPVVMMSRASAADKLEKELSEIESKLKALQ
jgi:chromosome segregation ATPase